MHPSKVFQAHFKLFLVNCLSFYFRLNRCKISSLYPWVGKLKESCPNLKYLCLMGNPAAPSYFNGGTFYEYLQYRYVLFTFRNSDTTLSPDLCHLKFMNTNGDADSQRKSEQEVQTV